MEYISFAVAKIDISGSGTHYHVREEVADFAISMESKLQENDHKGGWKECELRYLEDRLLQEVNGVYEAIQQGKSAAEVLKECAEVANFAMMIADNVTIAEKERETSGNIGTAQE